MKLNFFLLFGLSSRRLWLFCNVHKFKEVDALPVNVQFSLEVTPGLLLECRASWHNSCHLKFANSELERVSNKRKIDDPHGKMSGRAEAAFKRQCVFLWASW